MVASEVRICVYMLLLRWSDELNEYGAWALTNASSIM
jgi:hypothetical protein